MSIVMAMIANTGILDATNWMTWMSPSHFPIYLIGLKMKGIIIFSLL